MHCSSLLLVLTLSVGESREVGSKTGKMIHSFRKRHNDVTSLHFIFGVTFIYVIMTFGLSRVGLYVQGLSLWTRRHHWLLIYGAQTGHLTARSVRHTISSSLIVST